MKNNVLKGSILVALGASSYGMLATFVKMAYQEGFTTAEVIISQYSLGFAGLFLLTLFRKRKRASKTQSSGIKSIVKLIVAGTSLGLTSIFYYKAVQHIPVSVGIVLLMQTVWLGVILEMILHKTAPGWRKIVPALIILAGTVLAMNLLKQSFHINRTGFGWGMMAALTYTATMYTSNNIELHFPPARRSLYLILGGLIIISFIFHSSLNRDFSYGIFWRWGLILSLFGTILPPLLFTKGMPLTGMGLGAIIASIEIPVSVLMANILLKEPISLLQWLGIMLILFAVVSMNIGKGKGWASSFLKTGMQMQLNKSRTLHHGSSTNKYNFMTTSFKVPQLLLRLALGIGFLTTVSDRLGFLGPFGTRNIEWGNWHSFIDYTGTLMPFLDRPAVNIMGGIATLFEVVIGVLLIIGFKTRIAAIASCLLTLVFGLTMTIFLGIKAPINFAVFIICASSLILATISAYEWSLDAFFGKYRQTGKTI